MSQIQDMTGSLFRVEEKQSDRHPDFTGKALVNGTMLRVAAWENTSKAGERYLGLRFSEWKERDDLKPDSQEAVPEPSMGNDDNMPF